MADDNRLAVPKRLLHRGVPGNERLTIFSDGVFAIAITLLVLSLEAPKTVPPGGLIELVPEFTPNLIAHVVTFAILGIYWVGHHNAFIYIKRHDRTLLWLNILFLLFVAAMPFPTSLIVKYGDDRLSVIIYATTLLLAGLSLELIWRYATQHHRLVDHDLDPKLIAFFHRRILVAPLCYVLAIGLAFVSITAAKVVFLVVAIMYIVPNPLDSYHHKQFQQAENERETP
jgi:uncharacterized membrane protein